MCFPKPTGWCSTNSPGLIAVWRDRANRAANGFAAGVLTNLEETVRRAMWFPEYLPIRYEP